ncbi:MAG TPA: hypothetical protein VGR98_12210 [Streptosporangiaceae bacterium]|nr:hypothetical protein [Streptosporangiaceae bacterium]
MARYNRRDLFKHWIRREQQPNRPCTHACCRGYRPHPEHYPVVMPARYLRNATDDDLAEHYARCPEGRPACRDQVLAELNRRDVLDERRQARQRNRTQRWADRRALRDTELERSWLDAERATKGNMLNRRGREAGVDERSLFRGPESRARKYASEELLNYWEDHPRPTEAYFRGEDTRLGYAGLRRRITSQEQAERDYYERLEDEERQSA